MNIFSNIWQHPKTSAAGILIAVVTVTGVLSQQGVTLGALGTGTVVSFIGALAAALLGLLAKDPNSSVKDGSSSNAAAKLGVWMLIALLLPATCLPVVGCDISSDQLKSNASVLASALTGLSSVMQSSDADAASKLELAAQSVNAVVNHWDTASSAGMLNTAAAGVETALSGISSTSKYASLVAIAVAATDAILQLTATKKVSALPVNGVQAKQLAAKRALAGSLVQHRLGRSQAGDLKAAWNKAIVENNLPVQAIR